MERDGGIITLRLVANVMVNITTISQNIAMVGPSDVRVMGDKGTLL